MNKRELEGKFLDNIFDYISDESINVMLNSLPPDDEIDHEFSKGFQKNMNKILNRDSNRCKRMRTIKVCSRIAVVLGFLIIGSSIMVASVEAFRIPFLNFVFKEKEEAVEVCLEENNTAVEIDKEKFPDLYLPSYVPEGYSYVGTTGENYMYSSKYKNEKEEKITISQVSVSMSTMVNSKDSTYEKMTLDGNEYFVSESKEGIIVVWKHSKFLFNLSGQISKDDALNIVKNLKK